MEYTPQKTHTTQQLFCYRDLFYDICIQQCFFLSTTLHLLFLCVCQFGGRPLLTVCHFAFWEPL